MKSLISHIYHLGEVNWDNIEFKIIKATPFRLGMRTEIKDKFCPIRFAVGAQLEDFIRSN